jgi:hypothetical protein
MFDGKKIVDSIEKAGKAKSTIEFSCPYVKGFFVLITYANRMVLQEIRDASREVRFDPRSRERQEELNEDKLREQYATRLIKGWRGLTPRKLQKLLPELVADEADMEKDIPYSKEIAIALLDSSLEFGAWVDSIATTLENYTVVKEKQEEELENLA